MPTPEILKGNFRKTKGSDAERVLQIYNDREISRKALQPDIDRGIIANRMYFGLPRHQWPEAKLAVLDEQKRWAYQFNIIAPKVNTMSGAIITDMPDVEWSPIEGFKTTLTEAIKDTYYSDKEVTNWEFNLIELIKSGLIHGGWIKMIETTKFHPLGNIGLKFIPPGMFIPDAYWKTNDDRDLKQGWESIYMTPEGMAHKYEDKSDAVMVALEQYKKGRTAIPSDAPEQRQRYNQTVGDEFEVIEELWTEPVKKSRLIGRKAGYMQWVPFPISEDQAMLEQFAEVNEIDWDTVKETPYDDIIQHKTVICPTLSDALILYDRKSRVQVKGLSVFHFSASRYNGRDKGIVEAMADIQTTVNERISLETELIAKSNGGSKIVNENLFTDPVQKARFEKNFNKPGSMSFADLDSVTKVLEDIGPTQFPQSILAQINLMFDPLLPLVSGVSNAWSAESATQDSGILYERKVQMNKIGTLILDKQVKQLLNNIGEAYFFQFQRTYGDVERKITKKNGKEEIFLNKQVDEGTFENAVSYIPRCKVVISESVNSPTKKHRDRTMATEFIAQINPETNPLFYQDMLQMMAKSVDHSEEDQARLEKDMALERAVAETTLVARLAENQTMITQAGVQNQQSQAAMGQMGIPGAQPPPPQQSTSPEQQVQEVPQGGEEVPVGQPADNAFSQ
ncbi:MAG TPA: hypothetical protein VMV77_05255 [Bacteroidales bacterium]|nr:hypothetical protein [Bacteroidales bacterium]